MANTVISQLPVATALTGIELVPMVQNGVTVRGTIAQLTTFAQSSAAALTFQAPLQKSGTTVTLNGFIGASDNGVMYRASSAAVGVTAAGTIGQLLIGNGASTPPSWLVAGLTGQMLIGNTGASTSWLSAGVTGQILAANTGARPSWTTLAPIISSTVVTSFAGGSTGLTPAGATVGAVLLAGVLNVANGGTGVTVSTGTGRTVLNTSPSITAAVLASPSLTAPTISGILTYAGVALSAQVTGTGAMVLSTSPTITTPLLLTPSILSAQLTTPNIGVATGTSLSLTSAATVFSGTAIPAAGTTGVGFKFSSTANFGLFFGSGAPTLSAAAGSIYERSDGLGAPYYNNNGGGGAAAWTPLALGLATGVSTTFLTGSDASIANGSVSSIISATAIGGANQVWLITGVLDFLATGGAVAVAAGINNGTSFICGGQSVTTGANQDTVMTFMAVTLLTAATTFTLQAQANAAAAVAKRSSTLGLAGISDKMTSITCVRLA